MSRGGRSYQDELHMPPNGTANVTIGVAVRIARAYPDTPPSVQQLRDRFGMSRPTAFRWRAAFVSAMGLPR